ncbi:MAG: DUF1926 domain-containing protein [candidate division Zixibacteria bacterium]|nr:DUF1926 domain-containing protein [Candidatus Tariuqbacter arcticus]
MNTNRKIDFVFVIHNHQPVGNFDFVIEQTYTDSYEPFLAALEKHPRFRIGLHYSGYLWEYIKSEHPGFLERLHTLIERNQVEMLGGAHYEAILPVLPDKDADFQLKSYQSEMEKFSNAEIAGMWLAERIWEPTLPSILNRNGCLYTFLDEAHFSAAGLPSEEIWGLFRSEDRGKTTLIFPIDKILRYYIPFELAEKTHEELERRRNSGVYLITYGDDGEKFGGWPDTKKWVYQDGWLESFLSAIEASDSVNMLLPREAIATHQPKADIYLPCASYEEMGEWTLPAQTQVDLHHLKNNLERADMGSRVLPFIRGGFWRQFLAKYPESARIYRRMLRVSDKVDKLEQYKYPDAVDARRALMKGQANDAYWHGVFGGVYLPHLRFAVERELIAAENICDRAYKPSGEQDKYEPAALTLENDSLRCGVTPHSGGAVSSIDIRSAGINLINTFARQLEPYHTRLLETEADDQNNQDEHKSIHDRLVVKEENLTEKLTVDSNPRFCLIDRFLKPDFTLEALTYNRKVEAGDFAGSNYEIASTDEHRITLQRLGLVNERELRLTKEITLDPDSMLLRVEYCLEGDFADSTDIIFAPEFNINLLAADAPDRYFLLDGERFDGNNLGSIGNRRVVQTLSLVDDYLRLSVNLEAVPTPRWIWYPIETISLSEGGIERVYQGSAIHPTWELGELQSQNPVITLTIKSWKPVI